MTSQLNVSGCGHLVAVGVGDVGGCSGGYPSNRVGQCYEKIFGG